jgi:hypothetical protein
VAGAALLISATVYTASGVVEKSMPILGWVDHAEEIKMRLVETERSRHQRKAQMQWLETVPEQHVLYVRSTLTQQHLEFTHLEDALAYIRRTNQSEPWVILIDPGLYTFSVPLDVPPNTHMQGHPSGMTVLACVGDGALPLVTLYSNSSLGDVTLTTSGKVSDVTSATVALVIEDGAENVRVERVVLRDCFVGCLIKNARNVFMQQLLCVHTSVADLVITDPHATGMVTASMFDTKKMFVPPGSACALFYTESSTGEQQKAGAALRPDSVPIAAGMVWARTGEHLAADAASVPSATSPDSAHVTAAVILGNKLSAAGDAAVQSQLASDAGLPDKTDAQLIITNQVGGVRTKITTSSSVDKQGSESLAAEAQVAGRSDGDAKRALQFNMYQQPGKVVSNVRADDPRAVICLGPALERLNELPAPTITNNYTLNISARPGSLHQILLGEKAASDYQYGAAHGWGRERGDFSASLNHPLVITQPVQPIIFDQLEHFEAYDSAQGGFKATMAGYYMVSAQLKFFYAQPLLVPHAVRMRSADGNGMGRTLGVTIPAGSVGALYVPLAGLLFAEKGDAVVLEYVAGSSVESVHVEAGSHLVCFPFV